METQFSRLLSSDMFDGTVISKVDTSIDDEVDVEDDETALYGPPQYPSSSTLVAVVVVVVVSALTGG